MVTKDAIQLGRLLTDVASWCRSQGVFSCQRDLQSLRSRPRAQQRAAFGTCQAKLHSSPK
eukprot:4375932-Amphidinium_carterae.1